MDQQKETTTTITTTIKQKGQIPVSPSATSPFAHPQGSAGISSSQSTDCERVKEMATGPLGAPHFVSSSHR